MTLIPSVVLLFIRIKVFHVEKKNLKRMTKRTRFHQKARMCLTFSPLIKICGRGRWVWRSISSAFRDSSWWWMSSWAVRALLWANLMCRSPIWGGSSGVIPSDNNKTYDKILSDVVFSSLRDNYGAKPCLGEWRDGEWPKCKNQQIRSFKSLVSRLSNILTNQK